MPHQFPTSRFTVGWVPGAMCIAVLLFVIPGLPVQAQAPAEPWTFFVDLGYDSRYIGGVARDNTLDHGGYYTVTVGANYGNFSVELWEAYAAQVNFRETNFIAAYAIDITADLGLEIGHAFLDYEDGEIDNETYITLDYSKYGWFPSVTYLHAAQSNGEFLTLAWATEWTSIYGGSLELVGEFGLDLGYLSESHDEPNHLSAQAIWSRSVTENWSFNLRAQQVIALEGLRRAQLGNTLTFGIGVSAEF